jgi:hypothetical protein
MKTNLMSMIVVSTVLAAALCGCPNSSSGGGDDDPADPEPPVPVAVYLNDGMAFTNVATAATFSNTATAGIYRMDGAGDYLYAGNIVSFNASTTDVFSIKANGSTFVNNAWLSGITDETTVPTTVSNTKYFTNSYWIIWLVVSDGSVKWMTSMWNGLIWTYTAPIDTTTYPLTYTGSGTVTKKGEETFPYTWQD